MKALKSVRLLTMSVSFLSIMLIFSSVNAQEYDDMYFSKSDRKTVKVEKSSKNQSSNTANYKEVTKSTETYSAKNVNPEYIARYKSTESNEVNEQLVQKDEAYTSADYFVEGYDDTEYISDPNKNKIDYAVLNKRDQMSSPSNYNRSFSNPSWRFSPSVGMGFGYPSYGGYGYNNPYMMGYDPFMMGYGSGMTMGFGSGYGFSPSLSFNIGMSWGSGYNPYRYSSFYNPYGMSGYYDPWRSMYGYNSFSRYGRYPSFGSGYGYGGYCPTYIITSSSYYNTGDLNGRNIKYQPRTTRTSTTQRNIRTNSENTRVSSSDSKIRVPNRDVSTTASNGRVSKDYSKVQNEYYNKSRRSSSSTQRISSSDSRNRSSSNRSTYSASRYSSSVNKNKPSRTSRFSSGNSSRSSSSSQYSRGSSKRSSSSYSNPSRSSSSRSSSFSSGNSGSRSSSFSSGSSRSSSSSSSSRSSSSSSSRGGRQ